MAKTDATMATATGAPERAPGDGPSIHLVGSIHQAVAKAVDRISEIFRLVRAYNDLTRLDDHTLRDIGCRRGELDRILSGHRPRIYRDDL